MNECKCETPDCKSINATFEHTITHKMYCRNCSSILQWRANHFAFVDKSAPVILFDDERLTLNNS